MQAAFIPAIYEESHPVPNIVEEHKLYFNLHVICLMFTYGPPIHLTEPIHQPDTWDVCLAPESNMHNVNQSMHNELKVPISDIDDGRINYCTMYTSHVIFKLGDCLRRQECLRTFCKGLYSQPDLKRPHQLSAK